MKRQLLKVHSTVDVLEYVKGKFITIDVPLTGNFFGASVRKVTCCVKILSKTNKMIT